MLFRSYPAADPEAGDRLARPPFGGVELGLHLPQQKHRALFLADVGIGHDARCLSSISRRIESRSSELNDRISSSAAAAPTAPDGVAGTASPANRPTRCSARAPLVGHLKIGKAAG